MKSSPNDVELAQSEQSSCTRSEVTWSGTDGDSESHSDETDFLVFKDHGLLGLIGWLTRLQHSVGHKLLVLLVAVQHMLKGAANTLAWKSTSYLYKQYHVPAQQVGLFSSLCPKDMEATMFALIVGCHNLGVSVASSAGGLLLQALGCNPHGAPGDAEQLRHLWIASGISSLLPLLSVLLLFWLVPDGRQGERLQGEGLDATAGSLWRRLAQAE